MVGYMCRKLTTLQLLLLIILLGGVLRFWQLEGLPGEIFGDIVENLEHTQRVLNGDFKVLYGYDGRESLLYYLVAPVAVLAGNSYLTLKFVVVVVGLVTIPAVYLLARELFNPQVGLLSAFLVAVSKWPLIFSRIGFRAVLTPLFVALTLYFVLKAYRKSQVADFIWSGLLLGGGLYTYTAFRFMFLALFLIGVYLLVWRRDFVAKNIMKLAIFVGIVVVVAGPMLLDFRQRPAAYFAHPGPMLFKEDYSIRPDWLSVLVGNIKKQLLMFHWRGDIVFRVNPKFDPMLDIVSGIFFLFGVGYWFTKVDKSKTVFFWISFIVLQLPSVLVLNFPIDIPSATRSIGIIPLVYIVVAAGIFYGLERIQQNTKFSIIYLSVVLTVILFFNVQAYFVRYAWGLPNHNTPIGKIIAAEIDNLPPEATVGVIGCCWGDWGQPEPKGISYALKKPREKAIKFFDLNAEEFNCSVVGAIDTSYYLFVDPRLQQQVRRCLPTAELIPVQSKYGEVIFYKSYYSRLP